MGRKWVSWNVKGLGKASKRFTVKRALSKVKAELILLQETKLAENREKAIQSWANSMNMDFDFVPAQGSAGGLITMWRVGGLQVLRVVKKPRFLLLVVQFNNMNELCLICNVYGPNDVEHRGEFLAEIGLELNNHQDVVIIGGDFNAILNDGERRGSDPVGTGDPFFKHFVETYGLTDIPLSNGEFTWNSTRGNGLWSKIDRWLLNDEAFLVFNGVTQTAEDWGISDHRAINPALGSHDFGPKPFNFYNYWLYEEGFKKLVEEWWCSTVVEGLSNFVLQEKLKGLKKRIKEWNKLRGVLGSKKIVALKQVYMKWCHAWNQRG